MAYNIGQFTQTDSGFAGKIDTLALKEDAEFHRVLDRTNENAPAFEIFHGDLRIGAAWERQGKRGKYLSVSFEDPSFLSQLLQPLQKQHGVRLHPDLRTPQGKEDLIRHEGGSNFTIHPP